MNTALSRPAALASLVDDQPDAVISLVVQYRRFGVCTVFSTPRRFIKTGIGFLGVGLALGIWILVNRELRGMGAHPYLVSAHVHAVGTGFVMFVILGVAQWLFPWAPKDDSRYRLERVLAAYWVLTISTAVRVGTEVNASALGRTRTVVGRVSPLSAHLYRRSTKPAIRDPARAR